MNFLSLLEAKRDGQALPPDRIREFVAAYTAGQIPDYQAAAFLMAVYFRGLNDQETTALTLAMRDSGDTLRFPPDPRPLVDKHSTGGVGDKVSLPLAPLLASLGFRVPMISGRGLGITGGTLDKLDSIPGFQTLLPAERIVEIVQSVGCVICGQTDRMTPADKGLYALRDVTGTVASQPLIVASILSKKLAESLDALILDVKFGSAAFMPTVEEARELACAMVALGQRCGVKTRAVLSAMDVPLGHAAGNWLEVMESVACLEGDRSAADLRELVIACAAHLLVLCGQVPDLETGKTRAADCMNSGAPRKKWDEMLAAQGADLTAFREKLAAGNPAAVVREITAPASGWVTRCDARIIGGVIRNLGGGRFTRESVIDYHAGVDGLAKPGAPVQCGTLLARVYAGSDDAADMAGQALAQAFTIESAPPGPASLIREVIAG